MNPSMLAALVRKDITLYFKNRFFAFITVLGLVFYIAVYFLLPRSVDESLPMGWYAPDLPQQFITELREQGLQLELFSSEEALRSAVLNGEQPVGIAFQPEFVSQLMAGQTPQVTVYLKSDLPDEFRDVYLLMMEELSFMLAGQPLNIQTEEVVVGVDMAGQQIPPRQRFLPILAVLILMMESLGLASLISSEIETGTLRALLTTRLTVGGLFTSKGITGILMAFVQVLLLLIITGGLRREPALILVAMLVGCFMVVGISLMIASAARDLMSVIGWGMLAIIALAIPAMNILLPGLTSNWIKVIPSYYLVDILHRVINFNAGWPQMGGNLAALAAFALAFFTIGTLAIRRKLT